MTSNKFLRNNSRCIKEKELHRNEVGVETNQIRRIATAQIENDGG